MPAGITRLFAHPVMDWGMSSLTQKQLVAREVRPVAVWGRWRSYEQSSSVSIARGGRP